jgi:hypothetical protein
MPTKEAITVKKFMLKKFPTNEYIDCPVPKHHWETIQEYADQYSSHQNKELQERVERLEEGVKKLVGAIANNYSKEFIEKTAWNLNQLLKQP